MVEQSKLRTGINVHVYNDLSLKRFISVFLLFTLLP